MSPTVLAIVSAAVIAFVGALVAPFGNRIAELALPKDRADRVVDWLRHHASRRRTLIGCLVLGAVVGFAVFLSTQGQEEQLEGEVASSAGIVAPISPSSTREPQREACLANLPSEADGPAPPRSLLAGNNPEPSVGRPHGTGISHVEYPYGYKLNGRPRPSFNNFIDYSDGSPNDERPFMGARILGRGCASDGLETRRKIRVEPGDAVVISMYIHNNGGGSHNDGGDGPAVALDTRAGIAMPIEPEVELQVSSWLRATNAVVAEHDPALHTISDNISILSRHGEPIVARYVPGTAHLFQTRRSRNETSGNFQAWNLTPTQAHWLLSPQRSDDKRELVAGSGLPVGNDGSLDPLRSVGPTQDSKLSWFGCELYYGYMTLQLAIERAPTLLDA